MNWTLEVVPVPVTDMDRAKEFYGDKCGFTIDLDDEVAVLAAVVDQVGERRRRYREYDKLGIPGEWTGTPTAVPIDEKDLTGSLVVQGIGASAGVVEGRVRLITDPGEEEIEPGEILVAHTTDPSWASVLFLSSALVVDIGGVLSHAPVIARELGVPCVVNTKIGTKLLRTGDLCRVDGSTGRVEVLERSQA